jgi:putative aminopeptidase FrvX
MIKNKIDTLKEILSIPSFYGREEKIREYILKWAESRNIKYFIDKVGNIYLTKGESDSYPCMVAHMDTVHKIDESGGINIVEETYTKTKTDYSNVCDGKQVLRGYKLNKSIGDKNRTGCGGDDKAGIFLALEIIEKFDIMKGAFFVSEEIGCIGSREADPEFFSNVAYAIQHDSPENDTISWYCSGYQLFNDEWATPEVVLDETTGVERFVGKIGDLLYNYGVRIFARHPYTDVSQLKKKFDFQCINLPAAYYHYHSSNECVLIEGIETAFNLSVAIIDRLGNEKQPFEAQNLDYVYGSQNYVAKKIISKSEMERKVKQFFKTKYGMTDNDFKFLYYGLSSYLDDFNGDDDIDHLMLEFNNINYYY